MRSRYLRRMRASLPLALLVLTGCPRSDTASGPVAARPSGGATPDAAARAEFEDLAAACVAGDPGAVLPHLADQGLGGGPRYARAMRPDDPMAGEIVHDVCAALPPSLLVLATLATQSDGHAWVTVTVRDGDDGSIAYRFVDVGGAWLLAAVALRDDQRAVARQGRFAAADEHLAEQGQGAAADGDNLPASVVFDRCVLERDYGLGADVDHPRGDDLVAGIVDAGQRAIRVRQAAGGDGQAVEVECRGVGGAVAIDVTHDAVGAGYVRGRARAGGRRRTTSAKRAAGEERNQEAVGHGG